MNPVSSIPQTSTDAQTSSTPPNTEFQPLTYKEALKLKKHIPWNIFRGLVISRCKANFEKTGIRNFQEMAAKTLGLSTRTLYSHNQKAEDELKKPENQSLKGRISAEDWSKYTNGKTLKEIRKDDYVKYVLEHYSVPHNIPQNRFPPPPEHLPVNSEDMPTSSTQHPLTIPSTEFSIPSMAPFSQAASVVPTSLAPSTQLRKLTYEEALKIKLIPWKVLRGLIIMRLQDSFKMPGISFEKESAKTLGLSTRTLSDYIKEAKLELEKPKNQSLKGYILTEDWDEYTKGKSLKNVYKDFYEKYVLEHFKIQATLSSRSVPHNFPQNRFSPPPEHLPINSEDMPTSNTQHPLTIPSTETSCSTPQNDLSSTSEQRIDDGVDGSLDDELFGELHTKENTSPNPSHSVNLPNTIGLPPFEDFPTPSFSSDDLAWLNSEMIVDSQTSSTQHPFTTPSTEFSCSTPLSSTSEQSIDEGFDASLYDELFGDLHTKENIIPNPSHSVNLPNPTGLPPFEGFPTPSFSSEKMPDDLAELASELFDDVPKPVVPPRESIRQRPGSTLTRRTRPPISNLELAPSTHSPLNSSPTTPSVQTNSSNSGRHPVIVIDDDEPSSSRKRPLKRISNSQPLSSLPIKSLSLEELDTIRSLPEEVFIMLVITRLMVFKGWQPPHASNYAAYALNLHIRNLRGYLNKGTEIASKLELFQKHNIQLSEDWDALIEKADMKSIVDLYHKKPSDELTNTSNIAHQ